MKLEIEGCKLVMAEDGTEIDDDEVLRRYLKKGSALMLLGDGEEWTPAAGMPFTTHVMPNMWRSLVEISSMTLWEMLKMQQWVEKSRQISAFYW